MNIKKIIAGSAASAIMLANVAFPAFADHSIVEVVEDVNTCEPTTISASVPSASGPSNMYLVVDTVDADEQFVNIPTDGSSVSLSVGQFSEDTTVYWRVFGGGERDYDLPHWNGYGEAGFAASINEYGTANGFGWVIAGTDDPNLFTTWNTVEVDKCIVRNAEITSPTAGQNVFGQVDFTAYLTDDDADDIQWAVRKDSCAPNPANNVFGNVGGLSDTADIDQSNVENQTFSFTGNMTSLTPGPYCFIYNPVEDSGESDIRLSVTFNLLSVPSSTNQCKKGGWNDHTDHEGNSFKNQGDCVSYVATGGSNPGAGN